MCLCSPCLDLAKITHAATVIVFLREVPQTITSWYFITSSLLTIVTKTDDEHEAKLAAFWFCLARIIKQSDIF